MPEPFILAIQPDSLQASALRSALGERAMGEVLVVDSKEEALAVIDKRPPDLILLHPFMPPADEDYLIAYLGTVSGADRVQTIGIPQLLPSSDCDHPKGLLLGGLIRRPAQTGPVRDALRLFAADVVEYLARARAIKTEIEGREPVDERQASERRGGYRWSPVEVPWVSSVRLAAGPSADLINISSGGSLIRTHVRPELPSLKRVDPDLRVLSGVTFQLASGEEVHATGRVIRCRARSMANRPVSYEVAFRFDEPVPLGLPGAAALAVYTARGGVNLAHNNKSPDPASLQNELLAGLGGDRVLPVSVRDAALELARVDAALSEIRSKMNGAAGTQLLNLAKVHAPRLQELNVMRRKVVESISADDRALIAAYVGRSRAALSGAFTSRRSAPAR